GGWWALPTGTATILSMDKDCLRTGDKATVHFRFIKTPEYLHIDQRLVFREGRTKAVGTITKVWPGSPPCPAPGSMGTTPVSDCEHSRRSPAESP
uniref:Translation elongation factor EFTu/EF1A C-terminal domain-containing protein n=1 Tax=Ursus americanus TaxID=9643 RepID=A0A452SHQ0_URSAM